MYLSEEQAGLRANRSTVQQILTLHLRAVKAREYNQPVHNCFIDFKKAFDSVWHKGLWAVLQSFGVTYKIVRLLQTLYVLVDGSLSLTRWIQMTVGNRQGDPISTNTFLAFLERIMDGINEMEDKDVIIQGLPIYNLKSADDVDLIDKDPDNLQAMLNKLCKDSEIYGMCINKDKTKAMTFWRSDIQTTTAY